MGRILFFVVLFYSYSSGIFSQSLFNRRYDLDYADGAMGIQPTSMGYIIACTTIDNDSNLVRVQTISIDSAGNILSNYSFFKPHFFYYGSWPGGFCRANQTEYVLAGTIVDTTGDDDAVIYKFNATGDTLWMKRYLDTSFVIGRSINSTIDGDLILVGQYRVAPGLLNIFMIRTDSLGNLQWRQNFNQSWYDDALSVIQTKDHGYLIGGATIPANSTFSDALVLKTDSTGNEQWRKVAGNQYDQSVWDVVETQDSNFVVTGGWQLYDHLPHCCEAFGYKFYVMKLDKNSGNVLWMKLYDDSLSDKGLRSIIELGDGSLVGAGVNSILVSATSQPTFGTIFKFSANGDSLWERNYLPPFVVNGHGFLNDIIATSDGGFIAVGEAGGDTMTQDTWILKVDSMGCEVWNCLASDISEQPTKDLSFTAYPNPASGNQIQLEFSESIKQEALLQILGITGELIFQRQINKGTTRVELSVNDYSSGLYFARVTGKDLSLQTKFMVVRK